MDEFGCITFEEGFGRASLVSNNTVDHGDFETFLGFDGLRISGDDFDVDVVSTAISLKIFDFDEFGFSQFFFLSHILISKIMSIIFDYFNDFLMESVQNYNSSIFDSFHWIIQNKW